MIKKHRQIAQRKFYRLNQQIQAQEVRLLDGLGKQIAVLSKDEALKKAQQEGVDLIEIAPNAKPPVVKLIDFKKFLYQEAKKKKEEKKKAKGSEIKQVRLGPFISEHDLKVKVDRAREFLKDGNKVKIVVKFAGRQMAHPEFGHKTLNLFLSSIEDLSKIEREARFEGRFLVASVTPVKKLKKEGNNGQEKQNEDQKVDQKEI